MRKTLTVICALALVMVVTSIARAEVQNVKVSGDITTYGIWRDDFDLKKNAAAAASEGSVYAGSENDAWYQTHTRLRVDADLTDNVVATVRLINERNWGVENTLGGSAVNSNDIDIDLAYITLKELLYSPLTLRIGRQELSDLTDLIVGDVDNNTREPVQRVTANDLSMNKGFDTIRATLDYAPWTLDLLTSKIDDSDVEAGTDSEDLYMINAAYDFGQYDAVGETYLAVVNSQERSQQEIYTLGVKGAVEPMEGLIVDSELAYQFGDYQKSTGSAVATKNSRDQEAWAFDINGGYTWEDNQYQPNLHIGYSYRSGEAPGTTGGDYEAWDPQYENQTKGYIADYLLAAVNEGVSSNSSIINVGGAIKPLETVTLALEYYHYELDEKLVTSAGVTRPTGANVDNFGSTILMDDKKDLGDEIDLVLTYDYTEDVQFGLIYSLFSPGDAFNSLNNDDAQQVIGSVSVVF